MLELSTGRRRWLLFVNVVAVSLVVACRRGRVLLALGRYGEAEALFTPRLALDRRVVLIVCRLADGDPPRLIAQLFDGTVQFARELGLDAAKVNPNGGAIALGHPLGASGTRLLATLVNHLEQTGGRYGLQTMCEGNGMANGTVIERL